jgi:hypothetical protein
LIIGLHMQAIDKRTTKGMKNAIHTATNEKGD